MTDTKSLAEMRYVRGFSGFCDFSKGGQTRAVVELLHDEISRLMPKRGHEWGTEQFASNFAIANISDPLVLPTPKYANYATGNVNYMKPVSEIVGTLMRFIGAYRLNGEAYLELSKREIRKF